MSESPSAKPTNPAVQAKLIAPALLHPADLNATALHSASPPTLAHLQAYHALIPPQTTTESSRRVPRALEPNTPLY